MQAVAAEADEKEAMAAAAAEKSRRPIRDRISARRMAERERERERRSTMRSALERHGSEIVVYKCQNPTYIRI
jgi:hypothetical protein